MQTTIHNREISDRQVAETMGAPLEHYETLHSNIRFGLKQPGGTALIEKLGIELQDLRGFTCGNAISALRKDPDRALKIRSLLGVGNRELLNTDANILGNLMKFPLSRIRELLPKGLSSVTTLENPFEGDRSSSQRNRSGGYAGNAVYAALQYPVAVGSDLFADHQRGGSLAEFSFSMVPTWFKDQVRVYQKDREYRIFAQGQGERKEKAQRDLKEIGDALRELDPDHAFQTSMKIKGNRLVIRNPSRVVKRALNLLIQNQAM